MRRNSVIGVALLIAIGVAMAWCFSVMLGRRFAGGDVYPPCSTQRVDPMGAKALYDALDRLSGVTCERNFKRLSKLSDVSASEDGVVAAARHGQTLVLLDLAPWSFHNGESVDGSTVRDFAIAGGRVVITANGAESSFARVQQSMEERGRELENERRQKKKEEADKKKGDEKSQDADAKSDPNEQKPGKETPKPETELKKKTGGPDDDVVKLPYKPAVSLVEALKIDVKLNSLPSIPKDGHELKATDGIALGGGPLPRWLSRTSLDLAPKIKEKENDNDKDPDSRKDREKDEQAKDQSADKTSPTDDEKEESAVPGKELWQVLATVDDKPVLVERRFGKGSIVVATDSFFATNQALSFRPVPEFLAWLIGNAHHVIFDETHLGTQENPGIMTLARRYHLHGFFLGGVLLFALFVWQSSSSLVPATDDVEPRARAVTGQGAVAGLVSLLRRGVSRSRLLQTCFDEWVRNHTHPSPALKARIEQARTLLPPGNKRPARGMLVSLYQRLCETIHPNRH